MDYRDYKDLEETSVEVYETVAPENEFFHSIYIGGNDRTNHKNIVERSGYFHIRGVDYNLDEVYMVVIHTKTVLAKMKTVDMKQKVACFCYQNQTPWVGISGQACPRTSPERRKVEFCSTCRSQYILAGILTDKNGRPTKDENDKSIFAFLRANGIKFSAAFEYIKELSQLELTPICQPVTEESKRFEKSNVNIRRFVTKITKGTSQTAYGVKSIFKLAYGNQLPDAQVPNIMKIAQNTLEKFHEKFDWSRTLGKKSDVVNVSGYGEESTPKNEPAKFDDYAATPATPPKPAESAPVNSNDVSFEDVSFDDVPF